VFGYLSAATPWTPVSASGRAKRQRHSVTDPIARNRGFIRPRACFVGATLTWEGRASGKMVFAGALLCALQWAERRARRPLPPSAPRASARPDGSGPTPWRVVCLQLVLPQHSFFSSRISRETRTDRTVSAFPAGEQRLNWGWCRGGQR
jgi:hypothetical protein